MKVLIADDDRMQLRLLGGLVTSWGFEAVLAADGREAWNALVANRDAPKLALLDWMMTGMDGLEVIRKVRENPQPSAPYLILISARDSQQDLVKGLMAGANDYVKKPADPIELRARIEVGIRVLQLQESLADRLSEMQTILRERERTEAENQRLMAAIEQASEGVVITDSNGAIQYVNGAFTRMSGFANEEALGRNPRFLKSGKHDRTFYTRLWETIRAGQVWRGEVCNRRADGTLYTEQMSITAVRDAYGSISNFIAIKKDLTDQKLAEVERSREQQLIRTLMDNIPDAIYFKDASSHYLRVNNALAKRLGLNNPNAAIGKTDQDFFSELHAAEALADEQKIIATGSPLVSKEEWKTWPDERESWVSSTKMPLRTDGGEIVGTFGISHDITNRKKMENTLRESEQRSRLQSSLLNAIHDVSPDGILVVDQKGTILSQNRRFLEIWDIKQDDHTGMDDDPVLAAVVKRVKNPEAFLDRVKALYSDPSATDHCEIELKDDRTIDRISTPVVGTQGEYLGRVWFFRDVTARKQAELAKAEQARLAVLRAEVGVALTRRGSLRAGLQDCAEALVKGTDVAFARIWTLDSTARELVLEASAGLYTHISGAHGRVPLGSYKIGRIAQNRLPHLTNHVQSDPEVADHEWAKREGLVSFVGYPLMVGLDVIGVAAAFGRNTLTDTTMLAFSSIASQIAQFIQGRRADDALQSSEERARLLFTAIPHAAYVFDVDTLDFLEVNDRAVERYGYSREEFLTMKTSDIHSAEEAARLNEYPRANPGQENTAQWKHRTKDGRVIEVEISCHRLDYGGRRAGFTIAQDVTERKKMELDLRHAQKLESVGRLASGIAHEINTPIQFVGDNLRFLKDSFEDLKMALDKYERVAQAAGAGRTGAEQVEEIRGAEAVADLEYLTAEIPKALHESLEGVDRVATIVKAMKDFAHPQQIQKMAANINKALASTLVVARNELKYVADVETDFGELPMVECHLGDLNQVFLNLLVNSAHAIADSVRGTGQRGRIRVQTREDSGWVRIAISDNGCGIPESIRSKVFDPFFTTKQIGKGTGQGLAISRSIVVEKHSGTLTFESKEGHGTTFTISLPVSCRTE